MNPVDIHVALAELEDFFEGAGYVDITDAQICVQEIGTVLTQMADGIRQPDKGTQEVLHFPQARQALSILNRIERAITVKDMMSGLAACRELRQIGVQNHWMGFA